MRARGRGLATKWTRTNSSLVDSDKQRQRSETAAAGRFFEFDCGAVCVRYRATLRAFRRKP